MQAFFSSFASTVFIVLKCANRGKSDLYVFNMEVTGIFITALVLFHYCFVYKIQEPTKEIEWGEFQAKSLQTSRAPGHVFSIKETFQDSFLSIVTHLQLQTGHRRRKGWWRGQLIWSSSLSLFSVLPCPCFVEGGVRWGGVAKSTVRKTV